MFEIDKLSCGYGDQKIVNDISFNLNPGERLAILGPNGCGKTTLLRGITGILPSTGDIKLNGDDLRKMSSQDRSKLMALFTQMNNVSFSYTVMETVMLGRYPYISGKLFSKPSKEDYKIVETQLKRFGLWEERNKLITELSGGQLQRVLLARTFAQTPKILLLDEPTNHLDLKFQVELVNHLKNWTNKEDRAAIGVFHDLNLALNFADKILLMDKGKSVYFGDTENLDINELNRIYGFDVPNYMYESRLKWKDLKSNENENLQKSL